MKARILLVEDEPLLALQVEDALEHGGFEVIGLCQTVAQALDMLATADCCDAAVLDANLRNESALPVAEALTALGIPFVVTTGYDRRQLQGALAAAPILSKPLRTDDLITQLGQLLA
ncbi:response regulator [Polymorphobacter sp.]|uniref:response regulator n=1 Tax=Polymorphobacter sp. TaxID=1909290 RepID=UPI003F71D795